MPALSYTRSSRWRSSLRISLIQRRTARTPPSASSRARASLSLTHSPTTKGRSSGAPSPSSSSSAASTSNWTSSNSARAARTRCSTRWGSCSILRTCQASSNRTTLLWSTRSCSRFWRRRRKHVTGTCAGDSMQKKSGVALLYTNIFLIELISYANLHINKVI